MRDSITARRKAMALRHPAWEEMTLDAYLQRIQAEYAARPLVITDSVTLTYADVEAQALRVACGLTALGVRPGERVGLLMANWSALEKLVQF